MVNPLGTKGNLVRAFSGILHDLWHGEMPYITPFQFRVCILVSFSIGGADLLGRLDDVSALSICMHRSLADRSSMTRRSS
jgi:ubiquitin carboxyl-terminal hydrolase 8